MQIHIKMSTMILIHTSILIKCAIYLRYFLDDFNWQLSLNSRSINKADSRGAELGGGS